MKDITECWGKNLDFIGTLGEVSKNINNINTILVSLTVNLKFVEDNIFVDFVQKDIKLACPLVERCKDLVIRNKILVDQRVRADIEMGKVTKVELGFIIHQVGRDVIVNHLHSASLDEGINVPTSICIMLATYFKLKLPKAIGFDVQAVANVMINSDQDSLSLSVKWQQMA